MDFLRKINSYFGCVHPGLRFRFLKALVNLLGQRSREFTVTFYNKTYSGNLSNHIDFIVYFFGAYERGILNYLQKQVLSKDSIVLDVGANIGHHSLFFSSLVKHVYAFEPYENVRNVLDQKVRENAITNITIFPVGLSDGDTVADFFLPVDSNLGTGTFSSGRGQSHVKSVKLPLVLGDNYLEKNDIKNIDFIKIDVEGFEQNVIAGLKNTILNNRPIILMEFGTINRDKIGDFNNFKSLFPHAYEFRSFTGHMLDSKTSIFDYNTTSEINVLCIPSEHLEKIDSVSN